MANLEFPINVIDGNKLKISFDLKLYSKEAITATCYKYTGKYYIHESCEENTVSILFESKDKSDISQTVVKEFCNNLIDQEIRHNINKDFGYIRDLIVEEAFKPVNK
ncbi:MAG: His-Xaa-Ser system protein HxsD [Bacteroidaceae bacterium]|nr:His-Xaa-Ser system protein HxsD [Bacteroidaceae bacterium]